MHSYHQNCTQSESASFICTLTTIDNGYDVMYTSRKHSKHTEIHDNNCGSTCAFVLELFKAKTVVFLSV